MNINYSLHSEFVANIQLPDNHLFLKIPSEFLVSEIVFNINHYLQKMST